MSPPPGNSSALLSKDAKAFAGTPWCHAHDYNDKKYNKKKHHLIIHFKHHVAVLSLAFVFLSGPLSHWDPMKKRPNGEQSSLIPSLLLHTSISVCVMMARSFRNL
ncbi:unnamed protein product [Lota lota]